MASAAEYHGQVKWITGYLLLFSGIVCCQQVPTPDDPDSVYRDLAAKLRKGDMSIDFQALRFACSAAQQCEVRGNVTDLASEAEASKLKDWTTARQICEKLLDRGYADVEIHANLTAIFNELNDLKSMRFHRDIVAGLLGSIRKKKGDSKETAMEVISHREIYSVLASMQLPYSGPSVGWSSFNDNGHNYESYEIADPISKTKTRVYFNVDHVNKQKDVTNRP
jgi:hypothetical protein